MPVLEQFEAMGQVRVNVFQVIAKPALTCGVYSRQIDAVCDGLQDLQQKMGQVS